MIKFYYHERYNEYDLGEDHPLIGDKPRKTLNFLREKGLDRYFEIIEPAPCDERDLERVHTREYIDKIKFLSRIGGYLAVDTPAPKGIFEIASIACGGSKEGAESLMKDCKIAMNPLGGFHHASRDKSSGFCFFNDIAVAIEYVREKYNIKKVAIIDLDVHHANGTQEIYYRDPDVLLISFHQDGRTLYPGSGFIEELGEGDGEGYTINLPFVPGSGNQSYIEAFDEIVPDIIFQFKPEMIVYQSGVDTHHTDPLADMLLTYQAYHMLASRIKKLSEKTCKKLLVLFGGGYNSEASVKSYYNIVCALTGKGKIITEEEIPDTKIEITRERINKLKEVLSWYWSV
ncbi:MAG: acetoin utilization protein AcuC [Thermoplasmata archaeon]|nr:acetoin utilization protein AcuC [Thermoplasmata archaeon]